MLEIFCASDLFACGLFVIALERNDAVARFDTNRVDSTAATARKKLRNIKIGELRIETTVRCGVK